MGRKEEEDKRAAQIKAEQDYILHKKMENLGIDDFNHDIPPDEVDESEVERTWYHAFKSMIPYTNEWYEAKAAEEEMDGLTAIRIEQSKAKNLLALASLPNRGDEALRKLMAETNNDFHYFNRLKMTKMQELDRDGNPKYVEPKKKVNPFRDASGGKNRVKKAVKKAYQIFDESALKALSKKESAEETKEEQYNPADEDACCTWRGKSVHGEWLKCTNLRQRHPYLTVYKSDGSETPKITKFCGYHQPTCIDVDTHEAEGGAPKIPTMCVNIHGLCAVCLESAKDIDKSLPTATAITAPGVTPVDIALEAKKAALAEAEKDTGDEITEKTRCRWKPNAKESLTHVREYICKNTCYRNPENGVMIPYCAMHAKACVMEHGSDPGIITVPNIYGLCTMHHMALHKCEPVEVPFPYPGMEHKGAANAWRLRPGHWAAPNWPPKAVRHAKEWEYPGPPEGLEHFKIQINKILYFIRLRIFGRRVATKVQALWRKYKLQKLHHVKRYEKRRIGRLKQCVVIQSQMRRFLGARRHEERRALHLKLVAWISSHWRGFIYRLTIRREKASRNIAKFFKYIRSLKFKESVWMLIYIKRALGVKILKATLIQKMVRGLIARRYVRSIYLHRFHCNYRARQIGRTMRKCMTRKRRARIVRPPSEAIMRAFIARRLGFMVTEMWRDRNKRKELRQSLVNTLPQIQKMIRGYIGIKGTKKLLYLRESLRTWCKPIFALQFLQKQLTKSVIMFPPKVELANYTTLRKESAVGDTIIHVHSTEMFKIGMKILVGSGNHRHIEKKIILSFEEGIVFEEPLKHPHKEGELVRIEKLKPEKPKHTRVFLPKKFNGKKVPQNSEYYPYAIFDECVRKWYEMKGYCLLNSELEALQKIFRNPQDARMLSITALDDLIEQHEKPCRKHGRAVCGECIYHGECLMPKCKCRCFKGGEGTHSATCSHCPHNSTQHRIVPLQVKEKSKKATLLSLLHAPRMPDMSMPDSVEGVRLSKALDIKKPAPKKPRSSTNDDEVSEADTDYDDYSIGSEEEDVVDPADKVYVTKESNWKMLGTAESLVSIEAEGHNLVKALTASAKWETPDCEVMIPKQEVAAYALLERGENIAKNDEYWDYNDMSTVKAAADSEIPATIANFACPPEAEKVTSLQFWESATKNPNKTLRDYDEGFEHNIPMPVVIDKKIVYTFEGPKLYFSLLMQILDLEERIHYDDSAFLRLIVDHIQVFERHWRKFVSDIREGTLDRRCGVDAETRKLYEATAIPKPTLAKKLDGAFKDLGFHSKALGKDIKTFRYAELKRRPVKNPRERRPSLPKQELMDTLQLPDRSVTEKCPECGGIGIVFRRSSKVKCSKCDGNGTITTLPALWSPPTSPMTNPSEANRIGTGNSRAISKQEKRKMAGDALTNGMVEELLKTEGELAVRGPSRRSTRDGRRGSETDIARPATSQELQKIAQADLTTQPRAEYHDIVFDNGRFLCPFPACGQSFKSKDAAFRHISVHELRTRLSAPTPLPDSFMSFYWPKGAPWLEQKKFTKPSIPPGSIECPVEGCGLVFPNKARLESHLKMVHKKNTVGSFFDFTMAGDFVKVPPYKNPTKAPILYCANHVTSLSSCVVCMDVEVAKGPKPPLKFFGKVQVNFSQKELEEAALLQSKGRVKGETNVDSDHMHVFSAQEMSGVCVRGGSLTNHKGMRLLADVDPGAKMSYWNGRIVGVLVDANGDGWIALQRLYTARDLEARGYTEVNSENRLFELLYLPDPEDPIWTKMKNIEKSITLFDGTYQEFEQARRNGVFGDVKTDLFYVLPVHHHHHHHRHIEQAPSGGGSLNEDTKELSR